MKRLLFFPILILCCTALLAADRAWQAITTTATPAATDQIMVVRVDGTNETPMRVDIAALQGRNPYLSTNTFYLSTIIGTGDADVSPGSTDYGTLGDVGPQIQAIFDKATNGPIKVVFDGGYMVAQSLTNYGFTELHGVAGGGMILRSNVNDTLLRNFSWGKNTTYDTNISFTGSLILNGGGRAGATTNWLQSHSTTNTHWHCTVSYHGTEGFRMGPDVRIYGPRTFGFMFGRANNFQFSGTIDVGPGSSANLDGLKIVGPSTNGVIENMTFRCGDDAISIMGDDLAPGAVNAGGTGVGILGLLGWNGGPIDGVRIRNIYLQDGNFYGIRLGSKSTYVGHIDISSIYGLTRAHAILADYYVDDPTQFTGSPGFGNFGPISIENVRVRVLNRTYYPATIWIHGVFESLSVKNSQSDFADPEGTTPFLYVGTNSYFKSGEISGLQLTSTANQSHLNYPSEVGGMDDALSINGRFGQLSIRDNTFLKTNQFGGRAIKFSASVGQLTVRDNLAYGYDRLMDPVNPDIDNVITNAVYDGNQVLPGYFPSTSLTNVSPGVYTFRSGLGVRAVERDLGKDVNDGTSTADWLLTGNAGSEATVAMGGRGQNQVDWLTANRRRGYYLSITFANNPSPYVFIGTGLKDSDAADRSLASVTAATTPLTNGVWYRSEFDTITQGPGVRLIGRVQRLSDGYWLGSNLVWSAFKVPVVDVLATGTNVWRSPIPTIAVGFQAGSSTNGWLTSSNLNWTPKTVHVDTVPILAGPRVDIQGATWISGSSSNTAATSVLAKLSTGEVVETPFNRATNLATQGFQLSSASGPIWISGTGAPSASAPRGSMYSRTDGGPATTLYVNTNGSTGWTPVP